MEKSSSSSPPAPPSDITHHFFKVYLPSFSLHSLKIPTTFMKKLNGVISEKGQKAILKDPLERSWHVELKKVKDDFYFLNGWEEFVKYNCLKVGEFLVFSYAGNSVFNVYILDKSECEKEKDSLLAYGNNINITPLVKKEVESKNDLDSTKKNRNNTTTPSVKEDEEVKLYNQTCSDSVRWPSEGEEDSEEEEEEEIYKSKRSVASNGEMEEISKLLHFVAFIKNTTEYCMYIPNKLANRDDIDLKPRMLLRDPSRRSWPVVICFMKDRTVIGKGWRSFWMGNNLIHGDRCIFEFNKCKVRGRDKNSNTINVKFVRSTR